METITVYDNYEISGCRRLNATGQPDPTGHTVLPCNDDEADVWRLYGHSDGMGVEAIGDFTRREAAEEAYQRIVGEPFVGSCQAGGRLKLMHAAPRLLAACQMVVDRWEHGDLAEAAKACVDAVDAATSPSPPWASADFDVGALLDRRRQIASIWCIEDVQEVRPDLTDQEAWEVLKAADHYHDATIGINWEVLSSHAELLFGEPLDTDEEE